MAIIYSYPTGTPNGTDYLIGTQTDPITEENRTLQFSISQVATLATQGYLESTITLTAAQMLALHTTPVQLLPSPGGTKVVKLLAVSTFLNRTASSFSSNGSAGIDLVFPTNQLTIQARIQVILYTGSNDIAGSVTTPFQNGTSMWTLPLFATTATAILLGGTSTLSIKLRYQILDTTAF